LRPSGGVPGRKAVVDAAASHRGGALRHINIRVFGTSSWLCVQALFLWATLRRSTEAISERKKARTRRRACDNYQNTQ